MGRIEKLVVLVVLFAITAILVVSMNTGTPGEAEDKAALANAGGEQRGWSPTRDLLDPQPPVETANEDATPTDTGDSTGTDQAKLEFAGDAANPQSLLTSEVRELSLAERLGTVPAEWDLITLQGLAETIDPATLLSTCAAEESLEQVAHRFYGDASKVALLRRYNEGLRTAQAGQTLFIPVVDDTPADTSTEYKVVEGDNLWGIAKKVYGKGSRWEEIFSANSGLLTTPDSLRSGMVLRIP